MVRIGDPVTLQLGFQEMRNKLANAPAMDNKSGLWVCVEALRRAARESLKWSVCCVSTVAEEIGLRGAKTSAYSYDPHAAIAVDVTHATDCPTIDKRQLGEISLGNGPVVFRGPNMNLKITDRLLEVGKKKEIPVQRAASGKAVANDANVLQINRGGVACGLVSVPNRYMHSAVEMVSLDDLDRGANLLAEFAMSLNEADDFTP